MRAEFVLIAEDVEELAEEASSLTITRTFTARECDDVPHMLEPPAAIVVWYDCTAEDRGKAFSFELLLVDPDGAASLLYSDLIFVPAAQDHGATRGKFVFRLPLRFQRFGLHRIEARINGAMTAFSPLHIYRRASAA